MKFNNIQLVIEKGTKLEDVDKVRTLLDRLPLTVTSDKGNRNAADFAFMYLGIEGFSGGINSGRRRAVLGPCSSYSVTYEGLNKLSPKEYEVILNVLGKSGSAKLKGHPIRELTIRPKYDSEIDLDIAYNSFY